MKSLDSPVFSMGQAYQVEMTQPVKSFLRHNLIVFNRPELFLDRGSIKIVLTTQKLYVKWSDIFQIEKASKKVSFCLVTGD